jgi:hypothetical protein
MLGVLGSIIETHGFDQFQVGSLVRSQIVLCVK